MGIQVRLNQPIPVAGFPHQLFSDVEIVRRAINYVEIPAAGGDQILQLGGMPVIPEINDVSKDDRTMFLTFSRGFRVTENEVRGLFTGLYGLDAVADVIMQENISDDAQPLFARLILNSIATADRMLKGRCIAKFRVNGKHIWALSNGFLNLICSSLAKKGAASNGDSIEWGRNLVFLCYASVLVLLVGVVMFLWLFGVALFWMCFDLLSVCAALSYCLLWFWAWLAVVVVFGSL
ncbi:hypothetical protein Dsin_016919 [Dipteronia sinensis]|uniref:Uncharacterized protein n=1 Tax=Dipteronia sinensis TaxID=43782 RepID=A0AAE0E7F0_9ROSI|nr:hypothetical protein Dsin_016919 [Dipteronia sinensis]